MWEEDYIEYVCGLLLSKDNLKVLFEQLRNLDLLLIGTPFNNWIVQLFLRVAKDKRFSVRRDQGRQDYVADEPSGISPPTIFFYENRWVPPALSPATQAPLRANLPNNGAGVMRAHRAISSSAWAMICRAARCL